MESKAIRLTNKTAVALRENAKKTRNAYFIVGAAGTLALLGAAVYFGMQWLPAVPLLLASVMLPLAFLAYAYQDVYVDALLGAVAAYALIQWFTLPRGWERSAMTGAAMLALRTGVPIVPIYLPAEKKWFRWNPVVFGEAYYPKAPEGRKPTPEDYHAVADDLMERIEALKPQAGR